MNMIMEQNNKTLQKELITILGPTATGKTLLAANLAYILNGEVISADSRQVYRNMDIGTGKDLDDYTINNIKIPYHLINIADPGYEYNIYEYQHDFFKTLEDIRSRKKSPILCGGSGLYIQVVLNGYKLYQVPPDQELRKELEALTNEQLESNLSRLTRLHNTTDTTSRKRMIRAIEIARYNEKNDVDKMNLYLPVSSKIFGIMFERNIVRQRITERLKFRLANGMVEEVSFILKSGVSSEKLKYYGLEYKYITMYILGELTYNEMFERLNTAIHQFSKRQMTWFRKMEREGFCINWIDGSLSLKDKTDIILKAL